MGREDQGEFAGIPEEVVREQSEILVHRKGPGQEHFVVTWLC